MVDTPSAHPSVGSADFPFVSSNMISDIQSPVLDAVIVVLSAGIPFIFASTYLQSWLFKDYELKRPWVQVGINGRQHRFDRSNKGTIAVL